MPLLHKLRRVFARPRVNPRINEIVRTGGRSVGGQFIDIGEEKRPTGISFDDLEAMTSDPQIAASLALIKLPIIGLNWRITCPEDPRSEIPKHVEECLREIWISFIRDSLSALDFGFATMEKRWARMTSGRWKWRPFLPVHPRDVTILRSGNDFDGFYQGQKSEGRTVPADKAFVYTNDRPFGNIYGRPRTYAAYNPWWVSKHIMKFATVFFERIAQPLREGRAPATVERIVDGVSINVDGMQYLYEEVLKKLLAGATDYVLSSEMDPETNTPLWDVKLKELAHQTGINYIDFLKYLDTMKSRGLFIPDLAVFQNLTTGSRAMSESHGDIFWQMERGQIVDVKGHIDLYMLPQLVAYNFGPDAPACYWDFEPLAPETITWLKRLVDRMVQSGSAAPDLEELSARLGIDIAKVAAPPQKTPGDNLNPDAEREDLEKTLHHYEERLAGSHLW